MGCKVTKVQSSIYLRKVKSFWLTLKPLTAAPVEEEVKSKSNPSRPHLAQIVNLYVIYVDIIEALLPQK